jgi:hypothetical protein
LEAYKRQFWREHLTLNSNSVSGGSGRQWKQWVGGDFNLSVAGGAKRQPFGRIPERDSTAGPNQVDLAAVYNAALNEASPPTSSLDDLGQSLCSLPAGVQELGEVTFDARGVAQLSRSSPHYHSFPEQVRVPIGRAFHKLHALHGTVGKGREGTVVGHYELRYADGQEAKLEIRYGGDLRDWQDAGDPDKARPAEERSKVAWTGPRSAVASSRDTVGLYRTTYVNPRPELQVMHIDFVSRMTQSAPFLIALTVE